jgi:hypothetical protein
MGSPAAPACRCSTQPSEKFLERELLFLFCKSNTLVLQLYFWACTPFVVPILGDTLMPAAPRRPGQNLFHFLLRGQHKTPEETTNLADTQRHASPRVALNAAKLLGVGAAGFFLAPPLVGGRPAAPSTAHTPTWPR